MKRIPLRLRITLLCSFILIVMAAALTLVSVQVADKTYTNQFSMNFGEGFGMTYNGKGVDFTGSQGEEINKILDFALQISPSNSERENTDANNNASEISHIFDGAEKKFTLQSVVITIIFIGIGMLSIYLIVGRALKPVHTLSEKVKNINENNLYEKLKDYGAKDEIGSLTASYNQMLDRLSEAFDYKKNFAANAAHEFRTPLATMKAGIQVLEAEEEPTVEEYKEILQIVKDNNARLIQIVDNLLLSTKDEQDSFSELISVEKLFEEVINELAPIAATSDISLMVSNSIGSLKGNRTLLYRAIYNLAENGIKYNKKGGTVVLDAFEKKGSVLIKIIDSGIGIAPGHLEHIFEPFFRGDIVTIHSGGGSGLGLSIAKTIIEKHNGTIRVESIQGKGTTFLLEFRK
jgi:signal transduction histidine kinase